MVFYDIILFIIIIGSRDFYDGCFNSNVFLNSNIVLGVVKFRFVVIYILNSNIYCYGIRFLRKIIIFSD